MWDSNDVKDYAKDGTYIHGLFIEGARWPQVDEAGESFRVSDTECLGSLTESLLKELMPPMPVSFASTFLNMFDNRNTFLCTN